MKNGHPFFEQLALEKINNKTSWIILIFYAGGVWFNIPKIKWLWWGSN